MKTLTFKPRSIFSSHWRVIGLGEFADIWIKPMREEGTIVLGGTEYEVDKHGVTSGYWAVRIGDEFFVDAQKVSAFKRTFEIGTPEIDLVIKAQSTFRRAYEMEQNGLLVGTIKPRHAFSRKAVLTCEDHIPELVQLTCFWFAALMWRRQARNSS